MRILRVISSMHPAGGGPCQGIRNLVPLLETKGIQNEVVCLDAPDADYLGKDPFPIHAIGASKTSWAYSSQLSPWLRKHLSGFDCVVLHGLWQYPGYALLQALRDLRKRGSAPKWYIYPHGMLDPWFQKAESRKLKAIRNWIYWKLIENRVIAKADGILFTCEEELRLAATTFTPYNPQSAINVGYGIPKPPDNIDEQKTAFAEKFPDLVDKPFILFFSRIHPKKGVDLLIKAYAEIHKKEDLSTFKPSRFRTRITPLVIAGPGLDTPYGQECLKLCETLGLSTDNKQPTTNRSVRFPGMLSGNTKWGTIRSASAFILPSHQENFGIAVVEALACSTPVLISDKVNIWREIEASGAGMVGNDDLEGTIELLGKWIDSSSVEHTEASAKSILCFEDFFSAEKAAEKLIKVLEA